MAGWLLVARVFLFGVWFVSGVAKLADLKGSRRALVDFGLPERLAGPLGIALPLVELATGLALLTVSFARWGAFAACGLLIVFSAAMLYQLLRGRRPDCHCFGQLSAAPIGPASLLRNAVFLAPGLLIAITGGQTPEISLFDWLGTLSAFQIGVIVSGLLLFGLAAGLAWFLLQLFQQNGRLLTRLDELERRLNVPLPAIPTTGAPRAAAFSLPDLSGEQVSLEKLLAPAKPLLLIFSDPNCAPCNTLMPDISRWQKEFTQRLNVAVISRGEVAANRLKRQEYGLGTLLLQKDFEIAQAFGASATPSGVLIQPDGTLGSSLVSGTDSLRELVGALAAGLPASLPAQAHAAGECNCGKNGNGHNAASQDRSLQAALPGSPALALRLPDLDGRLVDLADWRGLNVAVLFWNPSCGFCNRLLPDIQAWEAHRQADDPRLLIISTGSPDANRALGLRSTILLDQDFSSMRLMGVDGTPSAVMVDAQGGVASRVAVGGPEVLSLLAPAPSLASQTNS